MLIGIDGSTVSTGFAFGGVDDARPKCGVWKGPGADELVLDRTLAGMSESLSLLIRSTKAERVCIEAPLMLVDRSAHTAMALIQLTGALRAAATRAGAKVSLVAVSTARRHFIGKGNLPSREAKRAVIERCRLLGWAVESSDAADACAVWCWGMRTFYPKWAPKGTPLFAGERA